jgi:hypothetical protein
MASGAVFLASRLQIPLVGLAAGYDSPWRARSWDRFALPRPWSRARTVVMRPYYIPADATRPSLEGHRAEFESLLLAATSKAETWAECGERSTSFNPEPTATVAGTDCKMQNANCKLQIANRRIRSFH